VIPLQVIAELSSPCIPAGGHLLLDGILLAGLGGKMGASEPGKWADPLSILAATEAGGLPLARVEGAGTWWYAASQAIPMGREELRHLHKRLPQTQYERFTTAKVANIATGPDKSLRLPQYIRPDWMTIAWTCVGDPTRLADLLWRVGYVGKMGTHGNGWVKQWRLSSGHCVEPFRWQGRCDPWEIVAPEADAYGRDLSLRHLPTTVAQTMPKGRVLRRRMPLRPPYHTGWDADATRNVPCWQIVGVAE
jgi:hypothetical protein